MGNFSQDPAARAAQAVGSQYVSVRLQQAVPLVDADWNLLDDLRRLELETIGQLFIGSGVPTGSDGFRISAVAQPNDFQIEQGLLLAAGKLARNAATVRYSTQPGFGQPHVAPPLPVLTTPPAGPVRNLLAYLDVWEREVDSLEDGALLDPRIGIETAVRMRREWVVRVARIPEDEPVVNTPAAGHVHVPLARLARVGGNANITANMIQDVRDTQLSVLRKIEGRDNAGRLVVENQRFEQVLQNTRNNYRALLSYLTTQFNAMSILMQAGEVLSFAALTQAAQTAEATLAQARALTLANRGALSMLRQLYDAQQSLMQTWRTVLLQLGSGSTKKYASYQTFVTRLDERLNQPVVGQRMGLLPALDAQNLPAAVDMQEEIVRLVGTAAQAVPRGSIQVRYTDAPPGLLQANVVARFGFRIRSFTTLADTYLVTILGQSTWQRTLVTNTGAPIPDGRIQLGPSGDERAVFVEVTPAGGTSPLQIRVVSEANDAEIAQNSTLLTLTQGQAAPFPEDRIQFQLEAPFQVTVNQTTGVVTATRNQEGSIRVRITNATGQQVSFTLTVEEVPNTRTGTWTVSRVGDATMPNVPSGGNNAVGGIRVQPGADAVAVQARYVASTVIAGVQVTAAIQVQFEAQ